MNTQLLDQQLELHFGDTYPDVVSQATKFCNAVVSKPWWQDRSALLNNEGGIPGMRRQALITIIEKEDIIPDGLKAYGLYLRAEYGIERTHILSLEQTSPSTIERQSLESFGDSRLDALESAGLGEDLQSLYTLLEKISLSPGERSFFDTYASVKDIQETCALLGLSFDEGKRLYDRVKHRAAYQIKAHFISP